MYEKLMAEIEQNKISKTEAIEKANKLYRMGILTKGEYIDCIEYAKWTHRKNNSKYIMIG